MTQVLEVSVIVPAYNAAEHLPAALDSVLAQTRASCEVIIVDDGSRDATPRIAADYAARDPRVRPCRCPNNLGPAGARNLGLDLARGTWVALLDADDGFQPHRLDTLIEEAERQQVDMIADDLLLIEHEGTAAAAPMLGDLVADRQHIDAAGFLLGNLPVPGQPRVSYGFLKPVFRRAFLEQHGLRYDRSLRFAEDFDLYLRSLVAGARFILVGTAGYRYRVRSGSATDLHTADDLIRLRAADRRLGKRAEVATQPALRDALERHLDSVERRLLWRLFTDAAKAGAWRKALAVPLSSSGRARLIAGELGAALPRILAKRIQRMLTVLPRRSSKPQIPQAVS